MPMTKQTIIDSKKEWSLPSLSDLWAYRELLLALTLRDIQVRYKQSVIGIAWVVIQPIMTMVVFTVVFGQVAKLPSDGLPYPVFTMVAILPWQLFAKSLSQGSTSLVSLGGVMSKVYFPRILAPLAVTFSGVVDFMISFCVLIGLLVWYGIYPGPEVLLLPFMLLALILVSLSISLLLCGINVKYRDVQHTLPFLVQIWMFITPVVYPLSMVPDEYRAFYMLNPMAGVVEGFRWALLDKPLSADLADFSISIAVTVCLFIAGLFYFNRFEKTFVDRL